MWILVTILSVFLGTFFLRAAPRFRNPTPLGSDVFAHLAMIEEVRRARHRVPDRMSLVLTGGYFCAPSAMYVLLSYLPRQVVERWVEPFWGAVLDGIQSAIVYVAALHIFTHYIPVQLPREAAVYAALVFMFTPILVRPTAGQFFLSARPFGNVLFTCAALPILFYFWSGTAIWLIPALFFLAMACMASKFTVQNAALLALLALGAGVWLPAALFVSAEVIAVAITRGRHLRALRHQAGHLWLYMKEIQFKHRLLQQHKSLTDRLFLLFRAGRSASFPEFEDVTVRRPYLAAKAMMKTILQTPELTALMQFPVLWSCLWSLDYNRVSSGGPYGMLILWTGFGLCLMLVTSFRFLRFLGEPDRYVGYVVVPASFLCAYHVSLGDISMPLYAGTLLFGALVISIHWIAYARARKRLKDTEDIPGVVQELNRLDPTQVMTIPTLLSKELMYRASQHRYLCFSGYNLGSTPETAEEFKFIFTDTYPYPRRDLDALVKCYNCRYLVVMRRILNVVSYDLSAWDMFFQNDTFSLYRYSGEG